MPLYPFDAADHPGDHALHLSNTVMSDHHTGRAITGETFWFSTHWADPADANWRARTASWLLDRGGGLPRDPSWRPPWWWCGGPSIQILPLPCGPRPDRFKEENCRILSTHWWLDTRAPGVVTHVKCYFGTWDHDAAIVPAPGVNWLDHPTIWRHFDYLPLEVGTAHPRALLRHLSAYGGVARWCYGRDFIAIFSLPIWPRESEGLFSERDGEGRLSGSMQQRDPPRARWPDGRWEYPARGSPARR